ncbi:prepilin-type N-terminal cleavage/methylation domain-containing protein [Cytobacillus sp. S13-E01]|uniref:type IV pilus modification PilV family protein n=1 Tax=Cytobacillus sp. S13-E01 TaxID=3031326 RepID=UPI0023D81891|nr:prepilin-type N-terminal cleavage/methylation domain-containing protein [Cytobacillus sp. S13-E01]MDF0726753.1 prepilin-type N-terminal cleavage/methylation domain-containing protein [Cytobacillus sp. S13-E01]
MIPNKFLANSKGFTLIEVMLSITILGIISLGMFSFFTQAYSYSKINEDKTLGIYVARNMLVYMERQNFTKLNEQYIEPLTEPLSDGAITLTVTNCSDTHKSGETVFDQYCDEVFLQTFNNVQYSVSVKMKKHIDQKLREYLIPTTITVNWGTNTTSIEGYVINEAIR